MLKISFILLKGSMRGYSNKKFSKKLLYLLLIDPLFDPRSLIFFSKFTETFDISL